MTFLNQFSRFIRLALVPCQQALPGLFPIGVTKHAAPGTAAFDLLAIDHARDPLGIKSHDADGLFHAAFSAPPDSVSGKHARFYATIKCPVIGGNAPSANPFPA
jgi:hypothetical protein